MKIFVEVYRAENITQAAKVLHMTQPAVSRSIQELEQYYGVLLFERMNRRLYITDAARNFYGHAIHILESFQQMEQELKECEEIGSLRIGSSISIGTKLLPGLIRKFQEQYPKIDVSVSVSNSKTVEDALMRNDLDLGLVEGAVTAPDLQTVSFRTDRMILIMRPDHPLAGRERVSLEDVACEKLLLREKGSAGRDFLDHIFAVHELVARPLWESTSTYALLCAVSEGIGISILPELLMQDALERGDVISRPIDGEDLLRDNLLVWHKNKYLSPALKDFIELCKGKS